MDNRNVPWCTARRQADSLRILKIHMSLLTQLEVTVYG